MVALGEIRKIRYKGAETLYCLILQMHKSSRSARVALISEISTPNCSQISLGNDLKLYPAIQGNLSTDSLAPTTLQDIVEIDPQILRIALGWPSFRKSDKQSAQADFNLILKLGDAQLPFSEEFHRSFEDFADLTYAHQLASYIGIQVNEGLLIQALRSGDLSSLRNTSSLSASLFSTPSLGLELKQSIASVKSDIVRFAIRRAINLRSQPSSAERKTAKPSEASRYFEFMRLNGIYTMTVGYGSKSEFHQSAIRRGAYTLRFAEMKVG